ncbi:MAG: glycoside hydrolase family 95 protein, partial [Asticcacaulis sp.]|nr:glycoside hydrolase family 95 protein [Asticcacaulis sp.]
MLTAGLAMAFPGLAAAKVTVKKSGVREDLELWYDKAAGPWVEALPVGNGHAGAMVFGRVAQERIQLNEITLSAGGPYDPLNPAMLDALPKVRALIDAGQFKEASDLADRDMIARPKSQMPYGAAGDLFLDFKGLSQPTAYRRSLALDTAVAATQFACGKARYSREIFASAPDQAIIVRLTAERGTLDFDLNYRHPRDIKYGQAQYNGSGNSLDLTGAAWDATESLERPQRPDTLSIKPDGAAALLIEGRNASSSGIDGVLRYAVRVAATGDGKIAAKEDRFEVRGATQVTLVIAAATSYVNFHDVSGDPVAAVRARSAGALRKPYALLKADHVAAHRALFRRMSIRLGNAADARPTSQRIATAESMPDPALAALYVQYARYLLISSSRPGGQPANLQGIWNEGTNPPWGSKYTININTEMNYWPAAAANLGECFEPLLRMVEDLAVTGATTARRGYNARGWVAHHNTDLWRASAPIDGAFWGQWPMGGAWLCTTLWTQYEYAADDAFLKRLYPLLKGASLFFVDTLVEDPKGRGLVTSPSLSPENIHPGGVALCAGPAMDRQILRDLFAATLQAHALVKDPDTDFAKIVSEKRSRLPADRIGAQGQLQEWLEDWDAQAAEQQHRHVSHLYGVYPSGQINVRDTPDLIAAAKTTLNVRGDKSTGWATAWRLALWARMGEGDRAHSILLGLLGPSRTYPNMFDAHPPFQIDGNFGGTAGILEMIVQSWGGEIHLLPALPSAWPEGSLRGVRACGGIELDIDWADGKLTRTVLRGAPGSHAGVRYAGTLKTI